MSKTRINAIKYEGYAKEGSEIILFGMECERPIHYALDIKDWARLERELLFALLSCNGNPIKLHIDNNTNKIIMISN